MKNLNAFVLGTAHHSAEESQSWLRVQSQLSRYRVDTRHPESGHCQCQNHDNIVGMLNISRLEQLWPVHGHRPFIHFFNNEHLLRARRGSRH